MKRDEFLKQVQSEAQLDSRDEAERVTKATLEVLALRIVGDEAKDLASQLPKEIGEYLRGREGQNGQYFSLEEFYQRVADKQAIDPGFAAMQVRAVMAVLQQAVSPGEFADVRANFSDDYEELFVVQNAS